MGFRLLLAPVLALLLALSAAPRAQAAYSQADLDQMLAPVALYPDPLLSQLLMASSYPEEVAEAARWTRANPKLQGDDAVRAVHAMDWDPSVKSLVAFPQIVQWMEQRMDWTRAVGSAFVTQEPQVMESVQRLRQRARAAGNLQSSPTVQVQEHGPDIVILPADPRVIYLPYYDPYAAYRPGFSPGFLWGPPVFLSANFFFGAIDWRDRCVHVVHVNNHYVRPTMQVRPRPQAQVQPLGPKAGGQPQMLPRPAPVRTQHERLERRR